jgi:hypothetical protein
LISNLKTRTEKIEKTQSSFTDPCKRKLQKKLKTPLSHEHGEIQRRKSELVIFGLSDQVSDAQNDLKSDVLTELNKKIGKPANGKIRHTRPCSTQ